MTNFTFANNILFSDQSRQIRSAVDVRGTVPFNRRDKAHFEDSTRTHKVIIRRGELPCGQHAGNIMTPVDKCGAT
jgi:hypothetical protein